MYAHLVCIANPYKVELCILLLFMVCWLCKWVKVLKLIEGGNKLIKTLASFRVYMSSLVSWRTLPPASFLYKTHTHRHTQLWRIAINEKFLKGFIRKQKYTNNHCCIKPLRPVFVVILLFSHKSHSFPISLSLSVYKFPLYDHRKLRIYSICWSMCFQGCCWSGFFDAVCLLIINGAPQREFHKAWQPIRPVSYHTLHYLSTHHHSS